MLDPDPDPNPNYRPNLNLSSNPILGCQDAEAIARAQQKLKEQQAQHTCSEHHLLRHSTLTLALTLALPWVTK